MKKAYLALLLICLIPAVGASVIAANLASKAPVPLTLGYPTMTAQA